MFLSIDRPRRIFRSSNARSAPRGLLRTAAVALAGAAAFAAVATIGTSGRLFGRGTAEPRMISAAAGQVAVIDGDTLRLDGVVVRLSDVAAPPRGQSCAAGPDCGGQATAALAGLVRDRGVECRVNGHDAMGRPAGWCDAAGEDLNVALVATGWARASTAVLDAAETDAKTHRRGIWLSN